MGENLIDGDRGWTAVNDRLSPALLPPGTLAKARNVTLEFGDIRPRWGISTGGWGQITQEVVSGQTYDVSGIPLAIITGFVPGCTYAYVPGANENALEVGRWQGLVFDGTRLMAAGTFIYRSGDLVRCLAKTAAPPTMLVPPGSPVTASIVGVKQGARRGLALVRHNDPEGYEFQVLLTDEARTADGGWGRAWKISSGTTPEEISLNGHDVWGSTRLVKARGATILLRHGNARWYWSAGAGNYNLTGNTLTFNTLSGLFTGDKVKLVFLQGTINPLTTVEYWVIVSGNTVKLAASRSAAMSATGIDITAVSAGTRIYLEKLEGISASGQNNETAPVPLMLSGDYVGGLWKQSWLRGFTAVPQGITATISNTESEWRSGNHNFIPGQSVKVVTDLGGFLASGTYYANPLDSQRFSLHASANDAMTATNPIAATASGSVQLRPAGYSALPMPGGREGLNIRNRLVIASGLDRLAISDPSDFLHFTPYEAAVTANLGESTEIKALGSLGASTALVLKEDSVLVVMNLNLAKPNWVLDEVTKEYGCLAPLSAVQVGKDFWFLSRAGVVSVAQTDNGQTQGVAMPVSEPISNKLKEVDWNAARASAGAWFNNRYLLAVPLKGQLRPVNNCVLVYNFLNKSWDYYWDGDGLDVVQFARHTVNGQVRLCWCTSQGVVHYFDEDALTDGPNPIRWGALTRGYECGFQGPKKFEDVLLSAETWYPQFSVSLVTEGVNEEKALNASETLDRTASFLASNPTRAPGSTAPYGKDYSLFPGDGAAGSDTLLTGVHQAVQKKYSVNARDWSVQIKLSGDRGSTRVKRLGIIAQADAPLPALQT